MTNDIGRRVFEHRNGMASEIAKKYRVTRLVYIEEYENPTDAISREKQRKGWKRICKNDLVRAANPDWKDLFPAQHDGSALPTPRLQSFSGTTAGWTV